MISIFQHWIRRRWFNRQTIINIIILVIMYNWWILIIMWCIVSINMTAVIDHNKIILSIRICTNQRIIDWVNIMSWAFWDSICMPMMEDYLFSWGYRISRRFVQFTDDAFLYSIFLLLRCKWRWFCLFVNFHDIASTLWLTNVLEGGVLVLATAILLDFSYSLIIFSFWWIIWLTYTDWIASHLFFNLVNLSWEILVFRRCHINWFYVKIMDFFFWRRFIKESTKIRFGCSSENFWFLRRTIIGRGVQHNDVLKAVLNCWEREGFRLIVFFNFYCILIFNYLLSFCFIFCYIRIFLRSCKCSF